MNYGAFFLAIFLICLVSGYIGYVFFFRKEKKKSNYPEARPLTSDERKKMLQQKAEIDFLLDDHELNLS